eukprot:100476_1
MARMQSKKNRKNKKKGLDENSHNDDGDKQIQNEGTGATKPRIFIDGTLGGGGHSLCLLQNLSPGDVLIGCDVDPSALATACTRLQDYIVKTKSDNEQ